ncbi:MAG: serine/threonine protein kinase [Pirellula sp.]
MSNPTRNLGPVSAMQNTECPTGDDWIGRSIGQYSVVRRLGEGGMGTVYEVKHAVFSKSFALKRMRSSGPRDAQSATRFLQEAKTLSELEHPNILRGIDAGEFDGSHYIVTEMLHGNDLQFTIDRDGPAPVDVACEWMIQTCRGLHHAHTRGFVHRDIKPSNLFLLRDGTIKLVDFGLVRTQADDNKLTQAGQFMGSVDYLAPEQASDPRDANAKSDIYSLGCTFLFLLSGKPPYGDAAYNGVVAKLKGHMMDVPQWLDRPCPRVREEVRMLIRSMLAKSPGDRPRTAEEVAKQLESLQRHKNPTKLSATLPSLTVGSKRKIRLLGASSLLVVAGIVTTGQWFSWSNQSIHPDSPQHSNESSSISPVAPSKLVKNSLNASDAVDNGDPDQLPTRDAEAPTPAKDLQSAETRVPETIRSAPVRSIPNKKW